MDQRHFDHLTRDLSQSTTRRGAFRTILALALAAIAGWLPASRTATAATDCCPADRPRRCGYTCVNFKNDPKNCGRCGHVCPWGTICRRGICDQAADFTKTAIVVKSQTPTKTKTPTKTPTKTKSPTRTKTPVDTNTPTITCSTASDCPDTGNECILPTCDGGTCGVSYVAYGTPLLSQDKGDCKTKICDGYGSTTTMPDDTDLPANDFNDCTIETCVSGQPFYQLKPPGTPCNEGRGKCSDFGDCKE